MNDVLRKVIETATDAGGLAMSLADSGLDSVRGVCQRVPLVRSLSANSVEDLEQDETHYFLVPQPNEEAPVLFSKRVLPTGVGAMNSLPKARHFHVPDASASAIMNSLLVEEEMRFMEKESPNQDPLLEALDQFGESVDSASESLTGGLLLLGGAVIWFNPVAGAGLALVSWAGQLGMKFASKKLNSLGHRVSNARKEKEKKKFEKKATAEVEKLSPEIHENPLLRALDAVFSTQRTEIKTSDYDPSLDRDLWPDSFASATQYQLTLEAIQNSLPPIHWLRFAELPTPQRRWLHELVSERQKEI